ncbi:glycosyltransferase family 9 protein [Pseudomarimonas arenosa]|uniref:Glycosyltransferase family 9 protein n=1 Tax=Pseudomarimonas arenosa TaxID=2774145 RepID=A0AAW3ZFZ1_9GAMM|nr:glycosyltransferase family 9 protein [Pseudomarimonas arenosa]MBD8525060.1 glycosyltransferase family 9 protein [Pseudomarimonas arenosa]
MSSSPAAPLVLRFGAMGDMVILTVLLRHLRARYGAPCDLVSSGGWTRPLLNGQPDVGQIHLLKSRRRPYWSDPLQWSLVKTLRQRPPGPVYVCDIDAQDKLMFLLQRAGVRPEWCVTVEPVDYDPQLHWCEQWRRFADRTPAACAGLPALPNERPTGVPQLTVGEQARKDLCQWRESLGLSGPLWLLQPGSKRTLKRGRMAALTDHKWWPVERWVQVARWIVDHDPACQVLLCGVPNEQPLLLEIAQGCDNPRVHALGEQLPMSRLLALAEVAAGMISIDTGPAHAAVAMGCPAVVLFGDNPVQRWCPRGPEGTQVLPLGGREAGISRVEQIDVDSVLQAWQRLRPLPSG